MCKNPCQMSSQCPRCLEIIKEAESTEYLTLKNKSNMLSVKIKKLVPEAVIPTYAKPGDAGMDLTAIDYAETTEYSEYKTGLSFEIPAGYVGLIFARSSISKMDLMLKNAVAVIDSGYRGEVTLRFARLAGYPYTKTYEVGERIGQIIIMPYPRIAFVEAGELATSERGTGGYGSTGLN